MATFHSEVFIASECASGGRIGRGASHFIVDWQWERNLLHGNQLAGTANCTRLPAKYHANFAKKNDISAKQHPFFASGVQISLHHHPQAPTIRTILCMAKRPKVDG